jgi:hypothetical protein
MREIFVSYRREDSSDSAGRLCGELSEHFGKDAVFRDVITLAPGCDFAETIRATIPQADVALVVIGKQWLRVLRRRIDDPEDLLLTEIETALAHRGRLLVIPVLVQRATMPKAAQLPPSLQALCTLNAIELDDEPRWEFDMRRLLTAIEAKVPGLPSAPPLAQTAGTDTATVPAVGPMVAPPGQAERGKARRGRRAAVAGAVVAVALLVAGLVVLQSGGGTPDTEAVLATASSSLPEPATTVPPPAGPAPTTFVPPGQGRVATASGGRVAPDPGSGRNAGPAPTSPPATSQPPPATTPPPIVVPPPPPAPGQLAIAPQSGPPGTVIKLSAGACGRPAGWSGGEIYYGLNDPRAGTDPVKGERWWTAPEPWPGQLTVPALPPGEYWVWANCYASNGGTSWEMFYLYPSVAFYVT